MAQPYNVNASTVYAIADSHFTMHLLAPGEPDRAPVNEAREDGDALVDSSTSASAGPLPENLIEDFVDEAVDMLDEVSELYCNQAGWERPLVLGFVDGVLAAADDSWSIYEDSYFEDANNPDFTALDDAITEIADDFDGSRPWDEAAKGYIRQAVARSDEGLDAVDSTRWLMCAHGFIYGVEAGYDQEWKVIVTPGGNVLLTDEDSITEAALAQMMEDSESGSLIDQVFDMIGIDIDELAAAFDSEGESVEAEIIDVSDAPSGEAH